MQAYAKHRVMCVIYFNIDFLASLMENLIRFFGWVVMYYAISATCAHVDELNLNTVELKH